MELALSPQGRVIVREEQENETQGAADTQGGRLKVVKQAFDSSSAEGLFTLAAQKIDTVGMPSLGFWRDVAAKFLTELCHIPAAQPASTLTVPPPTTAELASVVLAVPPMHGAEYLTISMLEDIWQELEEWVRAQVQLAGNDLAAFIAKHAPGWNQVGRVCFHLAENRRNPDLPFAFLATYASKITDAARVEYQPLGKALQEYAGAKNKARLINLLSPVQRATEQSRVISDLVDSGDIYHPLAWTPQQAYRFLQDVTAFEDSGIIVRLPDWWKKRPRPRVGVTVGESSQNRLDTSALLDFHVDLVLGDEKISKAELAELLAADDGLVLLKGQWVEVDRQRLQETLDHWKRVENNHDDGVSFIDGMRLLAGVSSGDDANDDAVAEPEWAFVQAGGWLSEKLAAMRDPQQIAKTGARAQLQATLRPYQEVGANWLSFLSSLGLGACLADDMGLGKTIQVLALLLEHQQQTAKGPALLVLPASLLANWQSELQRFAPTLRGLYVHPSQLPREELAALAKSPKKSLKDVDVVLTTYGMLLRQRWLQNVQWRLVVLDEAQAIKNPGARQTKAVKQLNSNSRIALTGTPVENRLSDLWSLFDFLCPGLLGSQKSFKQFVKRLQSRDHDAYAPLRRLVQPYILRRLKTDKSIIADLPDKTEVRAYCGLSKKQAVSYGKLVKELEAGIKNQDGIKRRGLVLSYLMRFKQLCNHPSQLTGAGEFTVADSGKFVRLSDISAEVASRQEKMLVFTQFREMTDPLSNLLATIFGRRGLVLHGGTAVGKRKKLVDQFQEEDGPPFFILSLKAGGTGLNLTAASHVVHFDRWWNPAVENQATDRAYRIGQKRNVLVHKFVCQGTVEERIDALIEEKTQLANNLLEGGAETLLTEMSDAELIKLVTLDAERAVI